MNIFLAYNIWEPLNYRGDCQINPGLGFYKGKNMKINKLLPCLMAFAAMPALAGGADAVAKRVGPVSYYGALHTDGGKIIGSKNKQEAMLRGMSWFWSDATGLPYYTKTVLNWATENLKIDVIRFAMGIEYYDSDGGTTNKLADGYSYKSTPDGYKVTVDQMVEAAVENDIYIIIDWHSHRADTEKSMAKSFFEEMAKKYANVPNVIFEIFNEPVHQDWGTVTSYANTVVSAIRTSSQNLVLVGTPNWSQLTQSGGVQGTNIGYVFHFYAGTHSTGEFGSRITSAKSSGNPVFITEWGTVSADGKGSANSSRTQEWFDFMEKNNISNCNWSLRQVSGGQEQKGDETSGMFAGSTELTTKALLDKASYSASGSLVKDYLKSHAQSWVDSLTKGKRSGSCAFKHATALETDGSIANVLPAGCTFVSSNEAVVKVDGSNLVIGKAGFSVLTGNDGTETVVTIGEVPAQTVPNFQNLTCNNIGSCTTNRTLDFSGSGKNEWILTAETKTAEGSSFTLTSLNPEIVTIKKAKCTSASCSNTQLNKEVTMYEFKGYGTAKLVATAAAISGYKAVNDTITVTYNKGPNKITNNFKDTKLAFGASADKLLPYTTMYHSKVTYTYNGKETSAYVTKNGNALVAGNQNAIVKITANVPETDDYAEFHKTITVIVGDSSQAVNKDELVAIPAVPQVRAGMPLQASISGSVLSVNSKDAHEMEVNVFSLNGHKVLSKVLNTNGAVSLAKIPNGSYLSTVSQGSHQLNLRWTKVSK